MARPGPRTWIACPGSGQRPSEMGQHQRRWFGRCATCGAWVAVTKRTDKLHHHAAKLHVQEKTSG
jgi:predicted ATP-dependent serine protease